MLIGLLMLHLTISVQTEVEPSIDIGEGYICVAERGAGFSDTNLGWRGGYTEEHMPSFLIRPATDSSWQVVASVTEIGQVEPLFFCHSIVPGMMAMLRCGDWGNGLEIDLRQMSFMSFAYESIFYSSQFIENTELSRSARILNGSCSPL